MMSAVVDALVRFFEACWFVWRFVFYAVLIVAVPLFLFLVLFIIGSHLYHLVR